MVPMVSTWFVRAKNAAACEARPVPRRRYRHLVAEIRKRRVRCPILLSVQVLSAVVATGMTQADVDEAFRRADEYAL